MENTIRRLADGTMNFSPEEIADGKMTKFINVLVEMGAEMHVWTDGYTWVVDYNENTSREYKAFMLVNTEEGDYIGNIEEDRLEAEREQTEEDEDEDNSSHYLYGEADGPQF